MPVTDSPHPNPSPEGEGLSGRIALSTALAFSLAACSQAPAGQGGSDEGAETIACALAGAAEFKDECNVERSEKGGIVTLVVRHPDGGFRRFDVLDGGRGMAVADGAVQAVTRYDGSMAEVAVERDRYRFPVTEKTHAAAR